MSDTSCSVIATSRLGINGIPQLLDLAITIIFLSVIEIRHEKANLKQAKLSDCAPCAGAAVLKGQVRFPSSLLSLIQMLASYVAGVVLFVWTHSLFPACAEATCFKPF